MQFVRVLIVWDLALPLNYNVLVERKGFVFFSDIKYENLPDFCSQCKRACHVMQVCKMLRSIPSTHKSQGPSIHKPGSKPPNVFID